MSHHIQYNSHAVPIDCENYDAIFKHVFLDNVIDATGIKVSETDSY